MRVDCNFDASSDFDLTFACQQRDLTHLAQIDTYRIDATTIGQGASSLAGFRRLGSCLGAGMRELNIFCTQDGQDAIEILFA